MSQSGLERFGAYQKAMQLFDLVMEDMSRIQRDPKCWRLVSQQVAAADSICSNIEEGHGRGSRKEYIQYLVVSRGSAREVRGRYIRMKFWLSADIIAQRTALCDQIIGILTSSIITLRKPGASQ